MAEQTETTYAYYPVFRRTRSLQEQAGADMADAAQEFEVTCKEFDGRVTLRGSYSSAGFRPDADLLMWWLAPSPEDHQDLLVALRRTALGRSLELTHAFMGVHRQAEFNPAHQPAFLKGEEPRRYLSVYPFVRTPEWYLLPREERGRMLAEHGEIGREFPDVLANTTAAFGMGDWEWILAFEADQLHRIVDCIRRLREAEARRFTKEEIPFVIGVRKPLAEAIADLA
jgi:hydrogen peroxide-dependent heme synthase